ncbi:MAG: hypothetical protein U0Q15_02895 [Kineosporiaceae bacterium]
MTRDDATQPDADRPDHEPSADDSSSPAVTPPVGVTDGAAVAGNAPEADALPVAADALPVAAGDRFAAIRAGGVVAPSLEDPVARAASHVAGGPAGRHLASAQKLLRAASVLVLLAASMMGLAVVEQQHCRHMGWDTPDAFWHACYSDIPITFMNGLREAPEPSLTQAVADGKIDQPPLAAAAMWTVAHLTPTGGDDAANVRRYFDASALALTIALTIGVAALAMSGPTASGRRPWDAAHLALSPVLVTSTLISYQLLAASLLAVALALFSRRQWVLAGVVLGLATAAHPVAFVVAIAAIAYSVASRRWVPTALLVAAASVTVMVVRILILPGNDGGLKQAWLDWKAGEVQFGSAWLIPSLLHDAKPNAGGIWKKFDAVSVTHASQLSIAVALFGVAAMVALALSLKHRPTLGQLALLGVGFFLLSSKNLAPQTTIILLPLIGAAGLKWRDHLIWATTEIVYWLMVWMYIGAQSDSAKGLPASFYVIFLTLRLAGIAWLMVSAVKRARIDSPASREPDPVPAPREPEPLLPAPVVEPVAV